MVLLTAAVAFGAGTDGKVPPPGGGAARPDTSAPDAWGYTWVRSNEPGGPTFGWIDITGRPGRVVVSGLTDDNVAGPFPMLFDFKYYWYDVNTFTVGSNGYIAFGNQPSAFAPPFAAMPNTTNPNNIVAPCVGDLVLSGQTGAGGQCIYWSNGVDTLIVSYINVTEWEQTINPANTHTFQIVLTKRDSTILFQYGAQRGRYNTTNNTRLVIGVENQTGQIGLNYTYSTAPPHALMPDSGLAIRIQRTLNTGLQITDAGVLGVFNFDNLADVVKVGQPYQLRSIVRNYGTAPLTNVLVTSLIRRTGQTDVRDTVTIPSLAPSAQSIVTFPRAYTPPLAGSYTVTVTATVPGDQGPGNNAKTAELYAASFAAGQSTRMQFENGVSGGSINWIGGGGVGVAFDLPADSYPAKVETVIVNVAAITTQPMLVEILDGSSGSPGAVLASRSVTAVVGNNTIVFDSVTVSGRYFAGARGVMAFSYEIAAPISYRSWEYTGGWAPYRSRDVQDVMIRTSVRQLPPVTPPAGWTTQTSGVTSSLRSVDAVSSAAAWISGASGVVLRTTNAGATWVRVDSARLGTATLHCIDAVDASTAFVGANPSAGGEIYKTTNGGVTWSNVFSQTGGFIDAIKMYDQVNGIALGDPVGGKWTILRTSDGGATWNRIPTEPNQIGTESGYNNSMATIGTTHIWFGSNASRIYRTTNAGVTWDTARVPFAAITGIGFLDASIGVAGAGSAGNAAARTTDGGVTWSPVTVPGPAASIYGVTARGTDFWCVKGTRILRSTDRGLAWDSVYVASSGTFQHMNVAVQGASVAGWALTSTGGIHAMYMPLTGVREVSGEIPAEFALSQNYPNPFNPSTTIRYTLPTASAVTLTVYNMLGQKVVTLADEVQGAGTFDAVWDGRNGYGSAVATGVYLLRIDARPADGGTPFNAIRKMVLMK
jgi:photosystem II stability/assembly factor-like uncharacterized protein